MAKAGLLAGACSVVISGCATLQPIDNGSLANDSHSLGAHSTGAGDEDLSATSSDLQQGAERQADDETQGDGADQAAVKDMWARIRNGFSLPDASDREEVQEQIALYARHAEYLHRVMERAEPYLCYIVDEVQRRGLPTELVLLPVVESAFRPDAYSKGRAAGLWQFTPGTAQHFGLRRSPWYDARRDIHASTHAALDYLELLNSQFDGDWFLTLAAYNAGGGTVKRAIHRNRALSQPSDYWSLGLSDETSTYVPKLLAVAEIIGNPGAHGVDLPDIPNAPYLTRVSIDSQVDLATAARLAGMSVDDMYQLNPGFTKGATDPQGPFYLMLPVDKASLFRKRLAGISIEERVHWDRYRIRVGDTLAGIARKYGINTATLRAVNRLKDDRIHVGHDLLIPAPYTATTVVAADGASEPKGRSAKVHVVQPHETVWRMAGQYGVSVKDILLWNHLSGDPVLHPGQKLKVWVKVSDTDSADDAGSAAPVARKVSYTVRRGDSLYAIAKRFRVSIRQLRQWNHLSKSNKILPGETLTVHAEVPAESI